MGEHVVFIDFDELFGSRDRFVYPAATEQRHAQAVQSILVIGVDLQGLSVLLNGLIQVIVAECVDRLLEIFFFRHQPPFYQKPGARSQKPEWGTACPVPILAPGFWLLASS